MYLLIVKKNSQCGLEPENFTFARQPIYEPPAEIVRPAQPRGHNQPPDVDSPVVSHAAPEVLPPVAISFAAPNEVSSRREKERSTVTPVTSAAAPVDDGSSLVEGRAKRKRVAPTRFEDEDFAEQSPIKKKPLTVKVEKTSSPQVGPQVTPPIKISIKPANSGGIRMPMILTHVVTQTPKSQLLVTPTLQVIAPKDSEPPKTSSVPVIKTETTTEETISVTALQPPATEIKPAEVNGGAERSKGEVEKSKTNVSITVTSHPQPAPLRKLIPKPSFLEKNLTRQFKP